MERFTLSPDSELAREFDALIAGRGARRGQLNPVAAGYRPAHPGDKHGGSPHAHLKPSR